MLVPPFRRLPNHSAFKTALNIGINGVFSTAFQEQTGLSFCTYLNRLKVNYAKSLLVRTDEKIGSVAAASGFTSQVNFLKVFKKETGLTPTQYRSREKAD